MNISQKAVKVFGAEAQLRMCQEECGELIVAINHYSRRRISVRKVLEEAADVQIMLDQVIEILDSFPEQTLFESIKQKKLTRLQTRIDARLAENEVNK